MKLWAPLRVLARRVKGLGGAEAILPDELRRRAEREPVLLLAVGAVDPRLPGEQRTAEPGRLDEAVRGVDPGRLIVAHCPCPGDGGAAEVALELRRMGYPRAVFLDGGGERFAAACPIERSAS